MKKNHTSWRRIPASCLGLATNQRRRGEERENSGKLFGTNSGLMGNVTPNAFVTRKNETPGGSLYYVPIVDEKYVPVVGRNYGTLEQCEEMYQTYAHKAGFDIRKSNQKSTAYGLVTKKWYVCNRAGIPRKKNVDTLEESEKPLRKSTLECTGCRAKARFDLINGNPHFKLGDFEAQHNHDLLPPQYIHLSKKERQLKYAEQLFVYNASISNIGPTKAHQLYSSMKGCDENVNGTVNDFRNWKRDLNVYISDSDSQMLVNKMEERKKYVPGFSFEYRVEDSELHSIFWADEVAKCNYKEFNDIMSFDATYRTNRYNLMFVPFTGIDNHCRCVTFAAGLIRDEKAETYTWLLNCFLKTFAKEPIMVVTDQDKAMEIAIKNVFKTSKHRLCMWHITQKLPTKVKEAIPSIDDEGERDFKKRFDSIVWNMHIEPKGFEEKWERLMNDFSLKNDSWFKHMFEIRSSWIPAYFIDTQMFGLMRTTSRSESENAFFSQFTKSASNLVNFMSGFDSAMFKQRAAQEKLDSVTIKKTRVFCTKLKFERQVSREYTHTVFEIIQKEIEAALYVCSLVEITTDETSQVSLINEKIESSNSVLQYKVIHNSQDGSIVCTCRHYLRFGLLCRHCFKVLTNRNIEEISDKYIMRRWRRDIIPPEIRSRRSKYGNANTGVQKLVHEAHSVVDDCIHLLVPDEKKLESFLEKLKALKIDVEADVKNTPARKKDDVMANMFGVSRPETNTIKNPPVGKYKGCGKDKRIMSGKEAAIKESNKRKRICGKCGETNHNSRTCGKQTQRKKQNEDQDKCSDTTMNK